MRCPVTWTSILLSTLLNQLKLVGHNSQLNEAHFDRWIGILRCLHDEQWWGLVSLENHNFLEVLLVKVVKGQLLEPWCWQLVNCYIIKIPVVRCHYLWCLGAPNPNGKFNDIYCFLAIVEWHMQSSICVISEERLRIIAEFQPLPRFSPKKLDTKKEQEDAPC